MVSGNSKIVTNGLVLHLDAANPKSYPSSGTTWLDLSPTVTSGSLVNGPVFNTNVNGSLFFDGTNDYVRIPDNDVFNFTGFTVMAWFNFAIFPAFSQYRLINQQESVSRAWGIQMARGDYAGTGTSSDMVLFAHSGNGSTWKNLVSTTRLTQSAWYHTAFSVDGATMKLYLNGVLDNSTTALAGAPYPTIASDIGIGTLTSDFNSFFWTGSIANIQIYNRVLSDSEVFQNYEATLERFNRLSVITDGDALAFLNAANIGNTTQQRAINELVVDLKNAGLWSKMKAVYPFVGGTASTHRFNLKDPRDLNAAFRLTFSGGWTHNSNGITGNGTNSWADCNILPSVLANGSSHISIYSRTNNAAAYFDISSYEVGTQFSHPIYIRNASDVGIFSSYKFPENNLEWTNTDSRGYYIHSRTSTTLSKGFKNGVQIGGTDTSTALGFANLSKRYSIGTNQDAAYTTVSNRNYAFATIGDGLTDSDAANLYTIVQKYQTTLGRQV